MPLLIRRMTPTKSVRKQSTSILAGLASIAGLGSEIYQLLHTRLYRNGASFCPLSAGVSKSPCVVRCEMVFFRMHPERTSTSRVNTSKPFTVWFAGILDGSDTSRAQVALADCVDGARSPEKIWIRTLRSQIPDPGEIFIWANGGSFVPIPIFLSMILRGKILLGSAGPVI